MSDGIGTWNDNTDYALGLYKLIMNVLGVWPLECRNFLSEIRVVIFAFLQITMMMSLVSEVKFKCSGETEDMVMVITLQVFCLLSLMKVLAMRFFNEKMRQVVASASEDWQSVTSPKAYEIMMSHARIGRSVCIFQLTVAYVTTIPLILGSLPFLVPEVNATGTNGSESSLRELPLRTVCIFSGFSDGFYAAVYVLQSLQLCSTCTANVGIDVCFFGIMMHLCGQFRLLSEDIESMDVDSEKRRETLVRLVARYVKLNELAQNLDDSFNLIILVQQLANGFQMCLGGITMILSLKTNDNVMAANTFVIVTVLGLQLFLYSYACDRLSSQVDQIGASAYFSRWYELPQDTAKDILFMIMKGCKSFSITAGRIYRVDLDSFKNLIKALGSYFSVLRLMSSGNKLIRLESGNSVAVVDSLIAVYVLFFQLFTHSYANDCLSPEMENIGDAAYFQAGTICPQFSIDV